MAVKGGTGENGESLNLPFSSPVGLNKTAQDSPPARANVNQLHTLSSSKLMCVKSRKAIEPSTGHKEKEKSSENNKQEK